jgi:orotate phosphoribosyltransferase
MINYRSIEDLNEIIKKSLYLVPKNISLIVGIPRSGLLVANLLALHLNLPLTDIMGLIENRIIEKGDRKLRKNNYLEDRFFKTKILVVDDSVFSGTTMKKAKNRLREINLENEIIFSAIFVSPEGRSEVDLYFEKIRGYRIFEWNLMHSGIAEKSCFDIDGVLCEDPTEDQNDDGKRYEEFLMNACPINLPSVKLGYLVTCRLEKYRHLTEQWLEKHGVKYGDLIMLDLPTKEARIRSGIHSEFKANVYKEVKAPLFVESSLKQANEISKLSDSPVLCLETQQMIYPSSLQYVARKVFRDPNCIIRRLRLSAAWLKKCLFDIHPPKEQL